MQFHWCIEGELSPSSFSYLQANTEPPEELQCFILLYSAANASFHFTERESVCERERSIFPLKMSQHMYCCTIFSVWVSDCGLLSFSIAVQSCRKYLHISLVNSTPEISTSDVLLHCPKNQHSLCLNLLYTTKLCLA